MSELRAPAWTPDPALPGYVTDGGLETDLIFHHGVELPHFAAFPLLVDPKGRELLRRLLRRLRRRSPRRPGPGCSWRRRPGGPTPTGAPGSGVGADGLAGVNTDAVAPARGARGAYAADVAEVVVAGRSARAATATSRARRRPVGGARLPPPAGRRRSPTPGPTWSRALTLTDAERGDRRRPGRRRGRAPGVGRLHRRDRRPAARRHDRCAPPSRRSTTRRRPTGSWSTAPTPRTWPPGWPMPGPGWSGSAAPGSTPRPSATPSSTPRRSSTRATRPMLGRDQAALAASLPGAARRRRLLRHRRPPRRGDVGCGSVAVADGLAPSRSRGPARS